MGDVNKHAEIPPSSADQIDMCPGSRKMIALFPTDDTIESREGTAAHWVLSELLSGFATDAGVVAPNGVTVNAEMYECAELVSDYIATRDGVNAHTRAPGLAPRIDVGSDRIIETTIRSSFLHEKNWGTPDLIEVCPSEIFVDDYKHGHKYVEVRGNKQLINYALLYCAEMKVEIPPGFRITLTIHQPRAYHRNGPHRSWSLTYRELLEYAPRLRERFALSMRDDAPVIPADPLICEHCPGRHACQGAIAMGYSAYEHSFDSTPLEMSPVAMGLELRILRRAQSQLKARISGLEDVITQRGGVPGWHIEHGPGRTVWKQEPTIVINAARALGVDIAKPGILTPTQAKKAGLPEVLLDAWTHKPGGAAELVQDDAELASRVFSS